jgi:hypothetical protein
LSGCFQVYRATAPGQARHWVPLRKGIADLPRRVTLAQAINARYLDALSVAAQPTPVHLLRDPVSRPRLVNGRRYRALRPITVDESRCFNGCWMAVPCSTGSGQGDVRAVLSPTAPGDEAARRRVVGRVPACCVCIVRTL